MSDREHQFHWEPLSLAEVANRFAAFPGPWWIAGGRAIDLMIGHQTRPHDDIDVLIRRQDQLALFEIFPNWEIHAAGMPTPTRLKLWRPETPFPADVHDIWCRPGDDQPWGVQVMLLDTDGDRWSFRRDSRIGGPLATMGRTSNGIPYLSPEIQLLYKSRAPRPRDEADYRHALPHLDLAARNWLIQCLMLHDPHNPWLGRLRNLQTGN